MMHTGVDRYICVHECYGQSSMYVIFKKTDDCVVTERSDTVHRLARLTVVLR